ncbi:hypothetical protein SLA2020_416830 [Shorea laevis]
MESLINLNFTISLSSICMLLLYATTMNPVFAVKNCTFPAIFNFGDSNSDTGGLSAAFKAVAPPYGETYFHMPVGRYSDGRLIIDFIAKSVGLPYLSAYLDSLGANFKHGANFATYASTIRLPAIIIPAGGGFSPFYLDVQFEQFLQFKARSQLIRQKHDLCFSCRGNICNLLPEMDSFPKALYTFDIGENDLAEGFMNMTVEEVNASVPDIVNRFSINVKNIYNLAQRDSNGCAKPYNDVAQYFNYKLKEAIVQLRIDLPLAAITYVDVYSVKYSLSSEPNKYGFELPLVACCGYGGKYNYNNIVGSTHTLKMACHDS